MALPKWMFLCLALLVSACASAAGGPVVSTGDRYSIQQAGTEDYKLDAGDKIRLTVFNEPTLSGEFTVSSDGTLSFPLIGDVKATGQNAKQVADLVQMRLADGYLRQPKVAAEVIAYRPFFILGEVKAPGQYPYVSGLTALNAVATAQGFTPRAARSVIYIRRAGAAEEEAFKLTPELRVLPGDTLRLGERYF